jgi:hypothetical protein
VLVVGFLASIASTSAAAAVSAPAGSISVRLVDAPINNRSDPRARRYIVDHVKPGDAISRRIEIGNGTRQRQRIAVYPAAAAISKGAFTVAEGHDQDELSSWISVDQSAADVPAGGARLVRVTIKVPKDASPGERYAAIWAEVRGPAPKGSGVTLVNRVGLRVYLSVGPGGPPAANFTITALTAKRLLNGQPAVLATVHNTGGRALDMSGTLKLSDGPGGLAAGPYSANLGTTLAIGDSEPVTVVLDKRVPDGPWHAQVDLRSGLLARSAQGTILFPKPGGQAAPVKAKPVTDWALRWLAAGLVLLLLVALISFLAMRRRRGRREEDEAGDPDEIGLLKPY